MATKNLDDMTEEELAAYYQQHKGDVSLWKKTPRPIRKRRGQGASTSFAVRLAPEELEELQSAATARRTTLSDFIRSTALEAARGPVSARTDIKPLVQQIRATRDLLEKAEQDLERSALAQ